LYPFLLLVAQHDERIVPAKDLIQEMTDEERFIVFKEIEPAVQMDDHSTALLSRCIHEKEVAHHCHGIQRKIVMNDLLSRHTL
jgi:hypothetical protein